MAISTERTIAIVDIESATVLATIDTPALPAGPSGATGIREVAWTDDDHVIAAGHLGTLFVVDVISRSPIDFMYGTTRDAAVVLDAQDDRVVVAPEGELGTVLRFLEPESGLPRGAVLTLPSVTVTSLDLQPDGDLLAVGTVGDGVLFVDMDQRKLVADPVELAGSSTTEAAGIATAATFSPDGRLLATMDSRGTLAVYDTTTMRLVAPVVQQSFARRDLAFAPDSRSVFVIGDDGGVEVGLDDTQPLASAVFGEPGMMAGAVRSDGRDAYGVEESPDDVPVWLTSTSYDVATGRPLGPEADGAPLTYGPGDGWFVQMRSDSDVESMTNAGQGLGTSAFPLAGPFTFWTTRDVSLIVSMAFDNGLPVIERLPDFERVASEIGGLPAGSSMTAFTITDDGRTIARASVAGDGTRHIEFLAVDTGADVRPPVTLPASGRTVTTVAFTPDGHTLAVGDDSGAIGVIDVASGRFEQELFRGNRGAINLLSYTADGTRLLAASGDGLLWWYDVATGQPIGEPLAGNPTGFSFDSGVQHVVAASAEGLRVWNFDVETWPELACRRAGRNLTEDEWDRYLPPGEPYRVTCGEFPPG